MALLFHYFYQPDYAWLARYLQDKNGNENIQNLRYRLTEGEIETGLNELQQSPYPCKIEDRSYHETLNSWCVPQIFDK